MMEMAEDLLGAFAFSGPGKVETLYMNPEKKGTTVAVIDASASMVERQPVMKLVASALKCITKTQGLWNLPIASGSTALVDAVHEVSEILKEANPNATVPLRVVIVSDGYDNSSTKEFLFGPDKSLVPFPKLPFGESAWLKENSIMRSNESDYVRICDLPRPQSELDELADLYFEYSKDMISTRMRAVSEHFGTLQCDYVVVGVGSEVKEFVAACAKPSLGIKTAMISGTAGANNVASIVKHVVKQKYTIGPKGTRFYETVNANNAPVVSDEAETQVTVEAKRTLGSKAVAKIQKRRVDSEERKAAKKEKEKHDQANYVPKIRPVKPGSEFNSILQQSYVEDIIDSEATRAGMPVEDVKGAVSWFISHLKCSEHGAECISLIGGRHWPYQNKFPDRRPGSIFDQPSPDVKDSAWTNCLNHACYSLTHDPHSDYIKTRFPDINTKFHTAINSNSIGALFIDVGKLASCCIIGVDDELPQLSGRTIYDKHKLCEKPNELLYYKFDLGKYTHVAMNDRAYSYHFKNTGTAIADLKVVWVGNSGITKYKIECTPVPDCDFSANCDAYKAATSSSSSIAHAPATEPATEPVAEPDAEPVAEPVVETVLEPVAETAVETAVETVTTNVATEESLPIKLKKYKRKLQALVAENTLLLDENKKLKRALKSFTM